MSIPAINQRVLDFCANHRGQRVGTGECWDLAELALGSAGAQTSLMIMGPTINPTTTHYVWGRAINTFRGIEPGDIIQYQNYVSSIITRRPNGMERVRRISLPHHTAIVAQKFPNSRVQVWEQNIGRNYRSPRQRVAIQNSIYLQSVAYTEPDSQNVIIVDVSGQISIYRPLAQARRGGGRGGSRRRRRRR